MIEVCNGLSHREGDPLRLVCSKELVEHDLGISHASGIRPLDYKIEVTCKRRLQIKHFKSVASSYAVNV
jgi:hypothetical protein